MVLFEKKKKKKKKKLASERQRKKPGQNSARTQTASSGPRGPSGFIETSLYLCTRYPTRRSSLQHLRRRGREEGSPAPQAAPLPGVPAPYVAIFNFNGSRPFLDSVIPTEPRFPGNLSCSGARNLRDKPTARAAPPRAPGPWGPPPCPRHTQHTGAKELPPGCAPRCPPPPRGPHSEATGCSLPTVRLAGQGHAN